MAVVYDNLKGAFKEGKPTDKSQNQSGLMAKELNALSNAGPEGHTLAYITPEEEKLLAKATGKETITTAYGIPTYETTMTFEEMEAKLTRDKIDEIRNKAVELAEQQNREAISKSNLPAKEMDEALTQSKEDDVNIIYDMLIRDEYDRISKIGGLRSQETINLLDRVGNKVKSLMSNTTETKSEPVPLDTNKDYHLNKFLEEQNMLMKSKEPYFPPQP
tara:strand:+ start:1075 stop:1728 length:654 start_codon:yes stop_codon:yes gene_type:complete